MPVHHRVQIIVVFVRLSPPKRLISLLPKYVLKIQLPNYNASELHSGHNLAQSQISLYPLFCHIRTERERMHTQTPHNDNCFYGYSVSECKLEIWKNFICKKSPKMCRCAKFRFSFQNRMISHNPIVRQRKSSLNERIRFHYHFFSLLLLYRRTRECLEWEKNEAQ